MTLPCRITPAERAVVDRLWRDESVPAVAAALDCSEHTVRSHLKAVASRLPNPHQLPAMKLILSFRDIPIDLSVSPPG